MSSPKAGFHTGNFGAWLTKRLAPPYSVYYDHGDATLPNVGKIKGFFGTTISHLNRLADVDLLVAQQGQALLLLEIEESPNPEPKKLLGDVLPLLLCNRLAFGQGASQPTFTITPQTVLLIAGLAPTKGQKRAKVEQIITPCLHQISVPPSGIQPTNVHFLLAETIEELHEQLQQNVLQILGL